MNVNLYIIEDYENEPPSGPKKQTQSKPISSKAKMSLTENPATPISKNQKKIWTIPKGTIRILVLDKLSISDLC